MTKHQKDRADQIFDVIEDFTLEYGYPPSVREIMNRVGLMSTSAVHHHLNQLVKSGRLTRRSGLSRSLVAPTAPSTAEDILRAVMLDPAVGSLDGELQERIGKYFLNRRRTVA